jgi:hypothetical protein
VHADDIELSQVTGPNGIQNNPANAQAAAVPGTSLTSVPNPKAPVVMSTEAAAPGEVDVPNTVDPAKAEILGFHLYMTSKEVIDLMEAKYNLTPTYNNRSSCRLCLNIVSDNEYRRPFYPNDNKFLSYVSVSTPTLELKISFTPIYPAESNRPEVATLIEYQPHLSTAADIAAFRQQVIAKFGRPSAGESFWCRRGVPHLSEDKSQSYYECDAHLPKMTLDTPYNRSAILTITDNGGLYWREKKQWESEKKALLPPL